MKPSTPPPSSRIVPATSYPTTQGGLGASGYRPIRAMTSAKFTPAAATSIRSCPGPSSGSGRSCTSSTPGPPCLVMTTTFTGESLSIRRSPEHDRPAIDEALRGDDLADDLGRHEHVGRDDHRG